ncbi:MAG: trimeric intracellular cation channel family protein [Micrococcales bacterium]
MHQPPLVLDWWVSYGNLIFESLGILAFAVSGLLEAARKKLDLVGMSMVTAMAAFGGGTLRDILLDRRPFFWVKYDYWVYIIIVMSFLALLFLRRSHMALTERVVQWPDAIGLGIFAAGGTQIALEASQPPIIAVLMGTFTAIVGGVARDVAVREVPQVFVDHRPYAVIAFTGGWIVVMGDVFDWPNAVSLWAAALFIIVLRALAVWRNWRLPAWRH